MTRYFMRDTPLCQMEQQMMTPPYFKPRGHGRYYWAPENQLWLATGGFGCAPNAAGRAVYATCLGDGERTRWNRSDFIGILKEEHLPDWARESLEQIRREDPAESAGMTTPSM